MILSPEQSPAQQQPTANNADKTIKPAKLDFDRLKEKPRLCINSEAGEDFGIICSNGEYFICCSTSGFILIDKEGHQQKLNIKLDFTVYDICWSSYLQKFFISSVYPDYALYLLDPKAQTLKKVNKKVSRFACYEKTLLVYASRTTIEVYRLASSAAADDDDECLMKSLEEPVEILGPPITCDADESIYDIYFSSDGKYVVLGLHYIDYDYGEHPESYSWGAFRAFRYDGDGDMMRKIGPNISNPDGRCLLALPNETFLHLRSYDRALRVLEYAPSTAVITDSCGNSHNQELSIKETEYDLQRNPLAIAICGNCLAVKTSDNEICLYDL